MSAAPAGQLAGDGFKVGLAAHITGKLEPLAAKTSAALHASDNSNVNSVEALFSAMAPFLSGLPDVVVCNAGRCLRSPLVALDPQAV